MTAYVSSYYIKDSFVAPYAGSIYLSGLKRYPNNNYGGSSGSNMSPPIEMRPRGGQRRKDLCRLENIREMTCIVAHVISRDTTRGRAATKDIYAFSKLPIKKLCNYIEQYAIFRTFCWIIFS